MKKVRLAIIGCGGFVRSHVKAISEGVKGFQFVGLADPARANAERIQTEYPIAAGAAIFDDYATMLREVQPEAVIISSPHTLHFRHAFDSLAAGAHVMVEKPMVTDAGDARKLLAKSKQAKRTLQIAIQGTHTDTFAYARKLLSDGTMGDLQLATGILAQGWMKGTAGKWRQDPKLSGGGQLYDSTAHVLSGMVFLVNSPVKEVFCWTDNKGCKVDINAVGTIRFANGCLATITSGGNCWSWKSHLTLQGSAALMEISAHGGNFSVSGGGMKKPITAAPRGWKVKTVTPAKNFYDVITGKDTPRCPGRLGVILADLMDGLYESARTGKPAKVTRKPPKE